MTSTASIRQRPSTLAASILVALITSACASMSGSTVVVPIGTDTPPAATATHVVVTAEPTPPLQTPWPVCDLYVTQDRDFPTTVEGLVAEADLIVTGRLEGGSVQVGRSEGGGTPRFFAQDLTVDSVLKGDSDEGDVVAVQLYFGRGGCVFALEGRDPMNLGEEGLFFIKRVPSGPHYVIVGGYQGAFRINDGRLAAVDPAYATSAEFEGKTLDEARAIVQDAARAGSSGVR